MDFAGKIRSGRAFLNWTQEKLAQESGLSFQGIQKIERGESQPTIRTQDKIIAAFVKAGVVFTSRGIDYEAYPVMFVEGASHEECYLKLLDDAFEYLRTLKNPEILIMFADDKVSPPSVNERYRSMREAGIRMRQLVQEGNDYLIGPLEEYRYIPASFFINRVTLIYGDRIANETANVLRGMIRIDKINADLQRNMFNLLWSLLDQPSSTTATETF